MKLKLIDLLERCEQPLDESTKSKIEATIDFSSLYNYKLP